MSSLAHTRAGITDAMITVGALDLLIDKLYSGDDQVTPFKHEFTIVIFIHYKPRIAVRLAVDAYDLKWVANEKMYILLLIKQFHEIKTVSKWCFCASRGFKVLINFTGRVPRHALTMV